MRKYEVIINGKAKEAYASRAAVAVHRAMDKFINGEFRPSATIVVRDLGEVNYEWHIVATVPAEPKGSTVRKVVGQPCDTEKAAWEGVRLLGDQHPEYAMFSVKKLIKE